MKPSMLLEQHRASIRRIVLENRACNPRLFGSVLNGSDTDGSDVDIVVDPTPETTLLDIGAIQYKLEKMLGVRVDVLTPRALPEAFRARILEEARPI